jgi:hypothetical protein
VGSEFLQAIDIRFASRERAILSQIEVGTGVIPGGGGLDRLPRLIGRARAMEVIVDSEDFDADTAERSEPSFKVTQLIVLALFVVLAIFAAIRFHNEQLRAA